MPHSTTANVIYLSPGKRSSPEEGRCAMEWVAYLAGEPHTDKPVCVSARRDLVSQ